MAPAIPGVAADIPGTGTTPSGGGGFEARSTSENALGLEVLFIGVVLVLLGGERWRVNASAIRATNWPNIPETREMGCDPTGTVLDRGADWSVLATEDESRIWRQSYSPGLLLGRFTPSSYRTCPGRTIAYKTWALRGHTESAKEQWKKKKTPETTQNNILTVKD